MPRACRTASLPCMPSNLHSYTDLLELDLPALAAGSAIYAAQLSPEPLYLVCTNGRRDPCCAANGPAVFRSLSRIPGLNVWQTSHVGGHRFAANLVYLPDGLFFGRLDPLSADGAVTGLQRGELDLDHFRGRACYAEPVQAAEYYLRRQTGLSGIGSFHLSVAEQTSAAAVACGVRLARVLRNVMSWKSCAR